MPGRINVDRIEVNGPRIPSVPIIRATPPPVRPPRPLVTSIEPPIVPVPGYVPPSYDPPTYDPTPGPPASGGSQAPSDDLDVDGVAEYAGSLTLPTNLFGGPREVNRGTTIELFGNEIPVPTNKEVTLAGTTAVASVSAALLGKSIVEFLIKLMKPIFKQAFLKVKKKMGKDLTVQEAQLYFAFGHGGLERVLKAEQRADLLEQQQLRQRRWLHTESSDETLHPHDTLHHNE